MRKKKQALTESELTLLRMVYGSYTYKEIAAMTGKSVRTVQITLSKIHRFLGVKGRYDAAMLFHSFGQDYKSSVVE